MNRGDLVSIAMQGDFGKPRPALVIQSDQFNEHATITVLLVSSTLVDAPSQVMVYKAMTVKRDKLGQQSTSVVR